MRGMHVAVRAAALAIPLLLAVVPPTLAGHAGTPDAARSVTFASRDGNDWWVWRAITRCRPRAGGKRGHRAQALFREMR